MLANNLLHNEQLFLLSYVDRLKPSNGFETATLVALGACGCYQPLPAIIGLAAYVLYKLSEDRKPLSPRITLPIPNHHYHPSDLHLSETRPVFEKLQKELAYAQAHMQAQPSMTEFATLAKYPAPFSIETHAKIVGNTQVGIAGAQGRRPTMEDAHIATRCASQVNGQSIYYELFGLIDGHGGSATAHFIASHMQKEVEKAISKHGISDQGIYNALKEAFVQLDARAIEQIRDASGAVAVITLKIGSNLWTANLGDCRAVLKAGDKVIQLSEDAKPTVPRFQKAIKKRGGFLQNVWTVPRVNGILAVARAFNDQGILGTGGHYAICARPKITKVDLTTFPEHSLTLIQACDGVWDVGSSKNIAAIAGSGNAQQDATAIITAALNAYSLDNCSALVTYLNH